MAEDPADVSDPSNTITLHPLKAVGNLRERYSETTADVNFVGDERLPAHRAVLSVASAVFFKMFDGDWRESREKNIPAPTEYSWEAFKAAIALLYGVEVEVDESSILDVYKVAHCYDLRQVKVVLAHAISQWDADRVDTVVELCALAGHLEAMEDQEEHEVIQTALTYIVKHLALIKTKPAGLSALPYQTMLKLVRCEDISVPELDVFLMLNQWMDGQLDITLRQAQQLYSHIRYGIIPYEFLSHGTSQENLILTLQNHQQLSVDKTKNNLKQIMPRLCQNEVLQVYPLVAGLSVLRKSGKWEFVDVFDRCCYTVGVIYSGWQELTFRLNLRMTTDRYRHTPDTPVVKDVNQRLCTELSSFCDESNTAKATAEMTLEEQVQVGKTYNIICVYFLDFTVTMKSTGAFLVLESHHCQFGEGLLQNGKRVCKNVDLPFNGPFPWILKVGVPEQSVYMTFYCE